MSNPIHQKKLIKLAKEIPEGASWSEVSEWSDFDQRLTRVLEAHAGLKVDLRFDDHNIPADELAISSILADCTSIYLRGGTSVGVTLDDVVETEWLTEPMKRDLEAKYSKIEYGYFYPLGEEAFCRELEPLIRAGRMMVRPTPALFSTDHEGKQSYIKLEPNLPDNNMLPASPSIVQESIPFRRAHGVRTEQKELISLALPCIGNVSISDLAKVLEDESDTLSSLRIELKRIVSDASLGNDELQERYNDLVRPEIDAVERRFRAVTAMHSLRISGAFLSVVGLSLAVLTTQGVISSVAALLGPVGLGLVAKEVSEYIGSRGELREMPSYLMWRLQRIK